MQRWMKIVVMLVLLLNTLVLPAWAEAADNSEPTVTIEKENAQGLEGNRIAVAVNSSQVLNIAGVERVAIANANIADVMVISGSEIMVVGKAPGQTTLQVWSWRGRDSYTVEVAADDVPIANEIKRIVGLKDIKVTKAGKTVILEGKVIDNYQKKRAEEIASAYGDKVINLLEITHPLQVKIEAKVIEISKNKTRDLGIKWGNDVSVPGVFAFGQSSSNTVASDWGKLGGYSNINAELDALVKNGAAKILSRPSMVTVSGEKANILVGGQIPIPVSSSNGTITVEWKEYGIKLDIDPEVNSDRIINSTVKAEVSSLDWSSEHQVVIGSNLKIPPLTTRKAETSIALASGQTMAIGGLYASTETKSVTKLPLLGDLPVLGALFTSKSFEKDETELIILVTPTIVDTTKGIDNSINAPEPVEPKADTAVPATADKPKQKNAVPAKPKVEKKQEKKAG
ncbi:bacterial general secretion pathway protein d signature [Lucifera butyrica]|uniref:Bacterial general secretion pathway protein d signature n=1 Tax=Lucifera butyrica TaxID=1351585 RepID=A0A498REE0_9FIRM|nr:pilus assembly protein N-terminal domain-containing protein [Lucifera butyrica]VBB08443.1 bacterial general secretion pathway protein d signature [Lucifera butyrica]